MKIPAQQNGNPLATCYCSQLDKALSEVNYAKPLKRQFLSQMQDSLYSYLETHPDARLEDLYAAFGTPQEAADSALLNTDSAQIKKQLKTSQLFHFLFAVVIAILVMVVVYRLGALAINRYVSQPYIIESPATVITGPCRRTHLNFKNSYHTKNRGRSVFGRAPAAVYFVILGNTA